MTITSSVRCLLLAFALSLFLAGCDDDCNCPSQKVGQEVILRDFEFAQGRIYDIGRLGADSVRPGDSIVDFVLYEAAAPSSHPEDQRLLASLYVSPSDPGYLPEEAITPPITVKRVDPAKYEWYRSGFRAPYVVLDEPTHYLALGYWMLVWRHDTQAIETVGDIDGDSLSLKLLWPGETRANDGLATWPLMWRNAYELPPSFDLSDGDIQVHKGAYGMENAATSISFQIDDAGNAEGPYIEILGLDQYNRLDQKLPDGQLDYRVEVYRPDWKLIIFPSRTPFNSDTIFVSENGAPTTPLRVRVPEVYSSLSENQKIAASQYFLRITNYIKPDGYPGPY